MTSPSTSRRNRTYKGHGYWAFQIIVSLVFGVGISWAGIFGMFAPAEALSPTGEPPERGQGFMMLLIGIAFLICFIVMLRMWIKSSAE